VPAGASAGRRLFRWGGTGQDVSATDLEAEYDNLRKVPGYPAIAARWMAEAARFRAAWPASELGLAYGGSERQALDLFWPISGRGAPIALFIHGGYWQRSHRLAYSHFARGLLAHGVAVAMPSYDLCPAVRMATIVGQVREAAAFLHRRHGGRLVALGHSAGGHLAAMLMATDWRARGLPADLVSACVPISGLFDLAPLLATSVNAALGLDAAEARRLSPVFLPPPAGRLVAFVGGAEGAEYLRQSRAIAAAWGGRVAVMAGRHHFAAIEPLRDSGSRLVGTVLALLGR
jgi:arylformamidase